MLKMILSLVLATSVIHAGLSQPTAVAEHQVGAQGAMDLAAVREKDFDVTSLDGQQIKLAQLLGTKQPVVINFWATWCAPCRSEIPHLVELAQKHQKQGLIVVGLTIEKPDKDRGKVKEFMQKYKINYPVAFAPDSVYRFFNGDSEHIAVPRVFVFAADAHLVNRFGKYYGSRTRHSC